MASDSDFGARRQSAAEVVADTLRSHIIRGYLPAGEPLRESQLARELQTSRNSLREGIRLLEQSRLVKYEMHRGAVVTEPNLDDLDDLFRTRLHLESAAARVDATDEQLDRVRAAFNTLESSAASADAVTIVLADLAMHQAIVDLLGSARISELFRNIREELVFYFSMLSYADSEYAAPQLPILDPHEAIADALCGRRHDEAARLIAEHIHENHERLKLIMTERRQ